MYLSKLELHGFKSFASRTVVDFSPGVTVVVGPNGCGKSNIVDAVRWVIGEQRARILRSEKMENVIFNGTQTRRALGLAEVQLTIENTRGVLPTEYAEVTIARRLYRSGESEYLLNGVHCRLKDITDLFMDTGMGAGAYSVIELKMIEELLSENAGDRRRLFEEAAGITKYKVRRAQTLRKLDGTQVDLNRVRDLTDELDKRVRSLERQAKKASRYKEHRDRLDILELALAQSEFDRLVEQAAKTREALKVVRDRLEADGASLAATEAQHEALRTIHIEREQAMVAAQGQLAEHLELLRRAESDERVLRERISAADRDIARLTEDREAASLRTTLLQESRGALSESIATARPTVEASEEALTVAQAARDEALRILEEHRGALGALRALERQALDARSEARRMLDRVSSRMELMGEDLGRVQSQKTALEDALVVALRNADGAEEAAEKASLARENAREERDQAAELRRENALALEHALGGLRDAQRRHDAAGAEVGLLESLLASYEDFSESVQFLAGETEWSDGPIRSVADCLGCDSDTRPALESALGEFASCLVVATEAEAWRAISQLKSADQGRTTFIVLSRLRALAAPGSAPKGLKRLQDLVRPASPELANLRDALLLDAYLIEDPDQALDIPSGLPATARVFTRRGEWMSGNGLLHGGSGDVAASASPAAARIGRREQLEIAQTGLIAAAAASHAAQELADAARAALEDVDLEAAERAFRDATDQLSDSQKLKTQAGLERDNLERRSRDLAARVEQLRAAETGNKEELETLEGRLVVADNSLREAVAAREESEAGIEAVEAANRQAASQFSEAKVTAVQARNHLDNLERDHRRTEENLVQLTQEQEERAERLDRIAQDRKDASGKLALLVVEVADMRRDQVVYERAVSETKEVLNETKAAISEVEAVLRTVRRAREDSMREENQLAVREAELATRSEDLVTSVKEDFEIDLRSQSVAIPDDFVDGEAKREVQELRSRIRNLGPVNALALESFEEERDRLAFLQEQLKDLEGAEATLLETISEINTTASTRFMETFEAIRTNFSDLFLELFGEDASADVVLENPSDPLESPVEIFAKPSGKKPSVLAQLSGGEKTLTAIALLFAIYLVKPSPFCILDEVDAPLDDANVDRFMHLIRTFSDSTQFILVTHNKRTMEAADRMYGITMQEQGVSRLVGVSFEEQANGEMLELETA